VLTSYIQSRQATGLDNGTINRELSVLGTAYKFGLEHGKVVRRPVMHLLKEARPRQGFFEEPQFLAVRKHLAEDLQVAVTIMWLYGWRRSEVMALQLSQIDLEAGTLRLEPGTTKNHEGRVVYMTPE
jgi:integrase